MRKLSSFSWFELRSALSRQGPLLVNALASALVAGFVGGLLQWRLLELPLVAAFSIPCACAALAGLSAVPIGIAECVVALLAKSVGERRLRRVRALLRLATSRAPVLGRRLVVRLHAAALAWLVVLGALAALAL